MDAFPWNDETVVNSFGFIVKNAGGDFSRFENNPVMLFQHDMDCIAGRWIDKKIVGNQIVATPEFDNEDEEAAKIKGKVERGFLKGCSMGIEPIEWGLEVMPDGCTVPVVTKWIWYETSFVSIPSNGAAVKLYADGKVMSDDAIKTKVLQLSLGSDNLNFNPNEMKLTANALVALSLGETASDADVSNAILLLKAKADKADAAETALAAQRKAAAETLVTTALTAGKITADKKDAFVALATSDFKQASEILAAIPVKTEIGRNLQQGSQAQNNAAGRETWTLSDWRKKDPAGLQLMRTNEPDQYNTLLLAVSSSLKNQGAIE